MDGQRDRQNYDPQDRTSIYASRGKNVIDEARYFKFEMLLQFAKTHHQIPPVEKWVWL